MRRILSMAARRLDSPTRLRIEDRLLRMHLRAGAPSMFRSMTRLAKLGFAPEVIVDVGAYHGDWTRDATLLWPDARVLMVEARESERPVLERRVADGSGRVDLEVCLLGPEDRDQVTFYELAGGATGSSVLPELSEVQRSEVQLPMRRLDSVAKQRDVLGVDLLKLDVQGFEIQVLEGAPESLAHAEVVVSEASLLPFNEGAPLIGELVGYFGDRGFQLFDVALLMPDAAGRTRQADLVFVRRGSALTDSIEEVLSRAPGTVGVSRSGPGTRRSSRARASHDVA